MQFNSLQFGLFLVALVPTMWLTRGRTRLLFLLAGSYLFYAAWDWRFLSLIVVSTTTDYLVARAIEGTDSARRRKQLLLVSLATNLGILGFFKYANFFVDSAADLLSDAGLEANPRFLAVALPVGISFYTFQTLSYTIDVYRGRTRAEPDPIAFACFVAFFPQLVAGPIERAERLLPQIKDGLGWPGQARFVSGIFLILEGLVRKVVVADLAAPVAARAFSHPDPGLAVTITGVAAFALQIYGDFSGYTAIARGTARLLGVELSRNFTEPYLSRSITEFWRRWHITLSNWLRDYLYIPLGGNRGSKLFAARNLMLTMLLGGLWHGAGWTFVVWGGLHGLYLSVERLGFRSRVEPDEPWRWRHLPATLWTFALVCLAWVFFRAETFSEAARVLSGLTSMTIGDLDAGAVLLGPLGLIILGLDIRARLGATQQLIPLERPVAAGVFGAVAVALVVTASGADPVPFVYFRF